MDVHQSGSAGLKANQATLGGISARPALTAFFERLSTLDYRVPAYSAALLRAVLSALSDQDNVIVDVCSSYGVNAALINHAVTLSGLYAHYCGDRRQTAPEQWAAQDAGFFSAVRRPDAVPIFGVDASAAAIKYGVDAGLLVGGTTSDLERERPGPHASVWLSRSTLISACNRVGYIGSRTFITLVGAAARPPVIAGFLLRWRDVRPIAQSLTVAGYEFRADYRSVYPHRRFASIIDQRAAVAGLKRMGLAETVVELNGYHGAVPFVAFPRSLRQRAGVAAAMSRLEPPAW
jgi:hypothetical protein